MVYTDRKSAAEHNESVSSSPPASSQSSRATSEQLLFAAVKESPKIVAYCLALASGILLYGYDLVIVGNVSSMPSFQRDFGRTLNGKLIIPSLWLGLWNVATPIGGIFGSILGGFIQDRTGRRFALALASIISAAAVAVVYVSNIPGDIDTRRTVFFVGKLVQGFAVNMVMCTVQTYMSEVLPPILRGPTMAFFPLFTLLGQLVGSVVVFTSLKIVGPSGYQKCIISQWPFSALPLVVSIILPESPTYLVRKDRIDEARKAQLRLDTASADSAAHLDQLQLSIRVENEEARNHPATYAECFRGAANRRRTIIVLFVNVIPQLFGLTLLAKSSYFLQMVGMSASTSLLFLQIGIGVGLVANIVSMWTLSRFGRVPLIISGLVIITIFWTAMGVLGCVGGGVMIWWSAVTLIVVTASCGATTWPATFAVGAEASSLRLRAKTQGLGWLTNCLATGVFGITLPYIFNPDQGALRAKTGFVFTGWCLLALAGTWFIIPEMKNRSPIEIDRMFELGLKPREFKGWVSGEDESVVVAGGGEDAKGVQV